VGATGFYVEQRVVLADGSDPETINTHLSAAPLLTLEDALSLGSMANACQAMPGVVSVVKRIKDENGNDVVTPITESCSWLNANEMPSVSASSGQFALDDRMLCIQKGGIWWEFDDGPGCGDASGYRI
jgi:hypothetical protein